MEFKNSVHPTKEQMEGFLEGDDNSPITMVNLLKFKDKAEYEDGRETNLSGKEAYAIYGKEDDGRYVCKSRLNKMLNQEYDLLEERLDRKEHKETRYFVFAEDAERKFPNDTRKGAVINEKPQAKELFFV